MIPRPIDKMDQLNATVNAAPDFNFNDNEQKCPNVNMDSTIHFDYSRPIETSPPQCKINMDI